MKTYLITIGNKQTSITAETPQTAFTKAIHPSWSQNWTTNPNIKTRTNVTIEELA